MSKSEEVSRNFRSLVEKAERKFARVRDAPLHPYGQTGLPYGHFFHKVFKAYMQLWKYQQENRAKLINSGLQRWEIGEIASRIGQLYFNQYMRTSEARFLLEAYVFYEAIFYRKYFNGSASNREIRFKELRFHARFLMVALILNRVEMVKLLVDRLKELVEESRVNFQETNFKEWKLVVQEILRFLKADSDALNIRPLRYTATYDSYPSSYPFVARYHAKRLLRFKDAILTSYHRNEVKFADLSLDTFRMLQCLEWEPSGAFYQKLVEPRDNGVVIDNSATSGMIDINLFADMTDPNLPPNPKKAVLYRPSVTQLIATIATACQELPPDNVLLIYISAPGDTLHRSSFEFENTGILGKGSHRSAPTKNQNGVRENHSSDKGVLNHHYENYLVLGPSRNRGSNMLFPGDIIPFTRRPIFLIIDSDGSHSFKILRGAEIGEPVSLFLSPSTPSYKNRSFVNDAPQLGSQFTFFLAAPLQAFCQLVDYKLANANMDILSSMEKIISESFSKWEETLCTSMDLDLAWAQLLCDPFLRRLILRFIFCRAVLTLFSIPEKNDHHLPECLPELPRVFSPTQNPYNLLSSNLQHGSKFQIALDSHNLQARGKEQKSVHYSVSYSKV